MQAAVDRALARGRGKTYPDALGWLDEPWVQMTLALVATLGDDPAVRRHGTVDRGANTCCRGSGTPVRRIPLASTIYGSARQLLDIYEASPTERSGWC